MTCNSNLVLRKLPLIAAAFFLISSSIQSQVIRYATLAPKGSVWGNQVEKMARDLKKKSRGKLKLRIYYAGMAGDEESVLRKVRLGQLHAASFTGLALGKVLPDCRVLEIPFFFKDYKQVDRVVDGLKPDFEKTLNDKGYVLTGWGEAGFVYLLTKKPVASVKDMAGKKIWAPTGDKLVKNMFLEFGLVPRYLGIESVLTQLQTGGLDAVYAPPMGAIGLQWFRQVNYYSDVKLTNATGATLFSKKRFDKLSPKHQAIVKEVFESGSRSLIKALRVENEKGVKTMKKNGLKPVKVPKSELKKLKAAALKVQNQLAGKLYSKEILEKAIRLRDR